MPTLQIMPSILAADMGNLRAECVRAVEAGADGLHIDVMDGHFVPNLSMGPAIAAMVREAVDVHLSVHLMITRPDQYADAFIDAGADTLIIHAEADGNPGAVLEKIRERGVRPGICINPDSPASLAMQYGDRIDEILVMSVHPGFGGQSFISGVLPKIGQIRDALPDIDLSVDGGVDTEYGTRCAEQGANILIAGSYLYRADDMGLEIDRMRKAASPVLRTGP